MSNAPNGTNIAKQSNILKIIRFTWVIRNDVSKKSLVVKKYPHSTRFVLLLYIFTYIQTYFSEDQ